MTILQVLIIRQTKSQMIHQYIMRSIGKAIIILAILVEFFVMIFDY